MSERGLDHETAAKRAAVAVVGCPKCGAIPGVTCHTFQYRLAPNATHAQRVRELRRIYSFKALRDNPWGFDTQDMGSAVNLA